VLVVAGQIEAAGSRVVNNIATWDGASWSTLGNGLPGTGPDAAVYALLVHDGQLYAGGYLLEDESGTSAGPMLRWTGNAWQAVGQLDVNATVGTMIEFNGGIVAAVSTSNAGSPAQALWWDGAAWQALGSFANDPGQPSRIDTLVNDRGSLVVGGAFVSVDGTPTSGLVRLIGAWQDMGLATGSECVSALSSAPGLLIVDHLPTDSAHAFHLRRLVTGAWTELPGPFDPAPSNRELLIGVNGDIFATDGGLGETAYHEPGIFRLVGSDWQPVGTSLHGAWALASFRNHLTAGGTFVSADGHSAQGIGSWDGGLWSALSPGLSPDGFWLSVAVSEGQVYASGVLDGAGPAVVRWNGQDWERLFSASTRRLEVYNGDLIVGSDDSGPGLRRFNGSTLETIGPVGQERCVPYLLGGVLYSVSDKNVEPGTVYRLDSTGWTQLGPSFGNSIGSIALDAGQLYILDSADSDVGVNWIGRWNGSAWESVGNWPFPVVPSVVNSVFTYNGRLCASGEFLVLSPVVTVHAFAVLNDDQWAILPSPYYGAMARVAGNQIVACAVDGETNADFIAAFDGNAWSTLATVGTRYTLGSVSDIQLCGDGLLLAGPFATVNNQCSNLFARLPSLHCCGSADFDADGAPGTDQDIQAFFACISGLCCPACGSPDFDGDGAVSTDADIEAFFRVLAGGSC
jgi:hypothetical protein